MQIRLFLRELMMVSSAIAVLPVWRSPISNSRWPRPIGIIVSMALMPVAMVSRTPWRSTTPGASRSTGSDSVVSIGPLSSMGAPSALTTRPISASPTGTDMMRAGALDLVAFADLGVVAQQHGAHLGLVQVHRQAGDAVGKLEHLARHHLVQAMHARNAVAQRDDRADLVHLDALLVVLNLLAKQLCYLIRLDLCHVVSLPSLCHLKIQICDLNCLEAFFTRASRAAPHAFTSFCFNCCNWPRTLPSYTVEPIFTTAPPSRLAIFAIALRERGARQASPTCASNSARSAAFSARALVISALRPSRILIRERRDTPSQSRPTHAAADAPVITAIKLRTCGNIPMLAAIASSTFSFCASRSKDPQELAQLRAARQRVRQSRFNCCCAAAASSLRFRNTGSQCMRVAKSKDCH